MIFVQKRPVIHQPLNHLFELQPQPICSGYS
jgi:hypothetical protein